MALHIFAPLKRAPSGNKGIEELFLFRMLLPPCCFHFFSFLKAGRLPSGWFLTALSSFSWNFGSFLVFFNEGSQCFDKIQSFIPREIIAFLELVFRPTFPRKDSYLSFSFRNSPFVQSTVTSDRLLAVKAVFNFQYEISNLTLQNSLIKW